MNRLRRSRLYLRIHATVIALMILSLLGGPLLQVQTAYAAAIAPASVVAPAQSSQLTAAELDAAFTRTLNSYLNIPAGMPAVERQRLEASLTATLESLSAQRQALEASSPQNAAAPAPASNPAIQADGAHQVSVQAYNDQTGQTIDWQLATQPGADAQAFDETFAAMLQDSVAQTGAQQATAQDLESAPQAEQSQSAAALDSANTSENITAVPQVDASLTDATVALTQAAIPARAQSLAQASVPAQTPSLSSPLLAPGATRTVCPSGCAYASIQTAINAASNGDVISVAAGTYAGNITVNKSLTIQGSVSGGTIVDGGNTNRVFAIAAGVTVVLENLTIRNGKAQGSAGGAGVAGGDGLGGGIYNQGTLTLRNSVVTNSTAIGGNGGKGGDGTNGGAGATGSAGNSANCNSGGCSGSTPGSPGGPGGNGGGAGNGGNGGAGRGGGIYNAGNLTLSNVTVTGNTVQGGNGGAGGNGGNGGAGGAGGAGGNWDYWGCYATGGSNGGTGGAGGNGGSAGNGGNGGAGVGAGVANGIGGSLTIMNSTVTSNRAYYGSLAAVGAVGSAGAGGAGGGGGSGGSVCSRDISGGSAGGAGAAGSPGAAGISGVNGSAQGGGLHNASTANVLSTILAGNGDHGNSPADCFAALPLAVLGYTLIQQNATNCWGNGTSIGNHQGVNPNLGSLLDNGGPALTQALDNTSPAFDAVPVGAVVGGYALCPASGLTDARGINRPKGNACDIGAFEFADTDISITFTGPSALSAGQQLSYVFQISNVGVIAARNVRVTTSLPAPMTFVPSANCSVLGTTVTCTIASIVAGDSATATFLVDVPFSAAPGSYAHTYAVTSDEHDTDAGNNSGSKSLALSYWDGRIGASGPGGDVNALAVNNSDLVYAGGAFGVKTWNGSAWSALESVGGTVYALTIGLDGAIYAGGSFGVKKLTGGSWSAIGALPGGDVRALAVDSDGRLHAGGAFTGKYAWWDTAQSQWISPPGGPNGTVYALAVRAPDVYAGGVFTAPGNNIARWSQAEAKWSPLNDAGNFGLSGKVNALAVIGSDIYAGGNFANPEGGSGGNAARWDGSRWFAVGTGASGEVKTLLANGSELFAGGVFSTAGNPAVPANGVARWNGANWSALEGGLTNGSPSALAMRSGSGRLYAGGSFTKADGSLIDSAKVAQWRRPATDLALTLSASAAKVSPSTDVVFTVGIVNNGSSTATSVVVRDTLPTGFSFGSGSGCSSPATGIVECPLASLTAGASASFAITAVATTNLGNFVNRAAVGAAQPDLNGANNYAEAEIEVELRTDLSLSLSGPATILAGERTTYALVAANGGPNAAPATRVTGNLPSGVTFAPAASTGSCTVTSLPGSNQIVVCDLGALASGVSAPLALVADVNPTLIAGTSLAFDAALTSTAADSTASPTAASLSTAVQVDADLAASLSAPPTVYYTSRVVYQLAVTNLGPSQAAGVRLSQSLPAGVTFETVTRPGFEIHGCSYDAPNRRISCQIETLAPGESANFTVKVRPIAGLAHGAHLASALTVSADASPDSTPANNTASVDTLLSTNPADNVAGLILLHSTPATTAAGGILTYTLVAANSGPATATGATLTSNLPASNVTFNPGASTAGCSVAGSAVICVLADLDAGDVRAVHVAVAVDVNTAPGTTLASAATLAADQGTPANAGASSTVVRESDLGVSVTAPATRQTGEDIVYAVIVTNHGPSHAAGVTLVNTLPEGVVFGSMSGSAAPVCAETDGVIDCAIGVLDAGASRDLSIIVKAFNVGALTDATAVSSTTTDPNPDNNQADAGSDVGQGAPQVVTLGAADPIHITANAFIDVGGGEIKALGDVQMGDSYRLSGAGDYLIIKGESEAEGFGTVTLSDGDLDLFTGDFTIESDHPDPEVILTPDNSVAYDLSAVSGFSIHSALEISSIDLSGGATTAAAALRVNPPGINEFVGAEFEIEAGPTISGTIEDFSFIIAGSIYDISDAELNDDGILAAEVPLTGPAQYGGSTSLLLDLLITPTGLSFDGEGASFPLGDIYIVGSPEDPEGSDSVVLTDGNATLSYVAGTYVMNATGVLSITLPNNEQSPAISARFDSQGNVSGNLESLDLDVAGGTLAMQDITISNEGLSVVVASYTLPVTLTQSSGNGGQTQTQRETTVTVEDISITDAGLSIGGAGITFPLPDIRVGDGTKVKFTELAATLGVTSLGVDPVYYLGIAGVMNLRVPQNNQDVVFAAQVDNTGEFSGSLDQLSLTLSKATMQLVDVSFDNTGLSVVTGTVTIDVAKLSDRPIVGTVTGIRIDADGLSVEGGGVDVPLPDFTLGSNDGIQVRESTASFFITADRNYKFTLAATIELKVDQVASSATGSITVDQAGNVTGQVESFSLEVAGLGIFVEKAEIEGDTVKIAKAGLIVPPAWGGLAVEVYNLQYSPDGFTIGGGRFQLPDIKVGSISLAGLYGSFEQKPGGYEISAGGKFLIPGLGGGGTCGILVGVTLFAESATTMMQIQSVQAPDGIDNLALKNIRAGLDGCRIPIGQTGFYLTRVEGLLTLDSGSTRIDLGISVEGGPSFAGYSAVRGDGHMGVVFDPFQIDLDGAVTVFAIFKAAEMNATVKQDFFRGALRINGFIGPLPATGDVSLTVWTTDGSFHLVGRATLTLGLVKGAWGSVVGIPLPPYDLQLAQIGADFGEFIRDNGTTWGLRGWATVVGVSVGFYFNTDGDVAIGNVDEYKTVTPPAMAQARAVWERQGGALMAQSALSAADQEALAGYAFATDTAFIDLLVPVRTDVIISLQHTGAPPVMTLVRPDGVAITPAVLPDNIQYIELPEDGVNFYTITQARTGNWQIKLSRDLQAGEQLQIAGVVPSPVLTDLAVSNIDLTHASAEWSLASAQISTTLNIFATTGPITVTQTITDEFGVAQDVVVDNFGGFPVAQNVPTTLDGQPNTAALDLSGLETGTYHLWFEANDLRNPPVRIFAPSPIQVVQNWQDSWASNVTATTGYRDVSVQWDANPNADVDGYELRIGALPGVVERVVEAGDFISVTVTGLTPDQAYYMTPVARDDDTGRKSVSGDTATVTAAPAPFQVLADTSAFTLIAGQSAGLNLTVSSSLTEYPQIMVGVTEVYSPAGVLWAVEPVFETLTPTVALAVGETPDGINLDLADDLVEATGTVVPVSISTSASLPGGVYTATLVGRSDGVEVSLPLHFTIQEPDFTLSASAPTLSLSENGSASLTFSAAALFGSVHPVHLSVNNVPVGMTRTLTPTAIAPNGADAAALTVGDTALLPNGVYTLTVSGEDGLHTHSVDVTVTVAKPGFGLTTGATRKLAASGDRAVYAIDVATFQWSTPVHLTLDQFSIVPGSVLGFATTAAGSPAPSLDVNGPATIYLIATAGATTRQILYPLTVLGSSGDKTASLRLELQVTDPASLDLGISQPALLDVTAGATYSYTLTVRNYGPGAGSDVVVTDQLPGAFVSVISATPSAGSCTPGAGVITCGLGALAGDAERTIVVTLLVAPHAPAGTNLVNVADVNSSNPATIDLTNNRAIGTARVVRSADVAVTQNVSGPTVAGLGLNYTLTVHNAGPSQASSGVVRDALPAGMAFSSADPACTYAAIAHVVTCGFEALAPGADVVYAIAGTVKPGARGNLVNNAQVQAQENDPVPANNIAPALTTAITPQVTLAVDKQVSTNVPDEGAVFEYVITVRNDGPSTATGVSVSDVLPAGLALAGPISRVPVGNGLVGAPPLLLQGAALDVGASLTITLPVNVVDGAGQSIINRVEAVSAENPTPAVAEVTITGVNINPAVQVGGPYRVNEGGTIVLVGVGIDAAGQNDPLVYEWDLDYDGVTFLTAAVGQAVTFDAGLLDGPSTRQIALRVTDGDGGVTLTPATITILNVAPKTRADADQTANEGDLVTLAPATFSDAGLPDTHTAAINWGDGSPVDAGVVTQGAGSGSVAGNHVYATDGEYSVNVCVTDDDGATGCDALIVTVNNLAPDVVAGPDRTVDEGAVIKLALSTFHDQGTLDTHTAAIDWGDGSLKETGVITETPHGPPGDVSGADGVVEFPYHIYADNGLYTVAVEVCDNAFMCTTSTLAVTVENVFPTLDAGLDQIIYEGDVLTLDPTIFSDPGFDNPMTPTQENFTATIDWGDGQQEPVSGITLVETPGGWHTLTTGAISGSHQYLAAPGVYTVTVTISDDDGATTVDTLKVTLINGFLRFCAYGDENPGVSLGQDASANCGQIPSGVPGELRPSGLGARGHVDMQSGAVVVGNLTSLDDKVDLAKDAQVQGGIQAGGDVKIEDRALVEKSIASAGKVDVKGEAVVLGDITAAGTITVDPGASVGSVNPNTQPAPIPNITLARFSITPGSQDVTVAKGGALLLSPATAYRDVTVKEGGTLTLSAGRYTLRKLNVDKDAVVQFDLTGGPIVMDVAEGVDVAERVKMAVISAGGDARNILFRVGKDVKFKRDAVLLGTYLAPDGHIELGENSVLTGALYAKKVDARKQSRLIGLPARNLFASLFVDGGIDTAPALDQADYDLRVVLTSAGQVRPGDQVNFTVQITNTGNAPITLLPLRVVYSKKYLAFASATTPADLTIAQAGILDWLDLTAPVGGALAPGQAVSVGLAFTAGKDTGAQMQMTTLVVAVVNGAHASLNPASAAGAVETSHVTSPGFLALPTKSDSAGIGSQAPTAVTVIGANLTPASGGVRLTWELASEVHVVGFYVVRAAADGSEQRLTADLIPAQMAGQAGGVLYTYEDSVDAATAAGTSYFVDVVLLDGQMQRIALGQAMFLNHHLFLSLLNR